VADRPRWPLWPWLLIAAVGCGPQRLYAGPARPAEEIAVVRGHTEVFGPGCYVQYVDGAAVLGAWQRTYEAFPEIELVPGEHRLSVGMRYTRFLKGARSMQNCLIVLPAQAGHTYEIHCETAEGEWRAWARDLAGGEATPCVFLPLHTPAR
jgi:hypothetical protein